LDSIAFLKRQASSATEDIHQTLLIESILNAETVNIKPVKTQGHQPTMTSLNQLNRRLDRAESHNSSTQTRQCAAEPEDRGSDPGSDNCRIQETPENLPTREDQASMTSG